MNVKDLKPKELWGYFAEMCAIPHPSHHEAEIRNYIVAFAKKHDLDVTVDEGLNVIVRKPAAAGMEDRATIVLQAHLDMVPQANGDKVNAAGKPFDFTRDAIEPRIDGDRVKATGTTLGADNGIGVAAMMSILASKEIKHGAIEALFTATEETGMEGAFGLKEGELQGRILVNLDSERQNELCVGCAGGTDANMEFPYKAEKAPAGYKAVAVEVKGLKGGHSGIEIIMQRANANKVLMRTLLPHLGEGVMLASVDGGGLRNAIPREARAEVVVKPEYYATFVVAVAKMEATLIDEFKGIEDSISLKVVEADAPAEVFPTEAALRLARLVCLVPDGVVKMSVAMPGLVQTSTNFARMVSDGKVVKMQSLTRSSARSEKEFVCERIVAACELAGAKIELTGSYDGWNPDMSSPILKTMAASYEALFGEKPEITAVHAGLECGIIGGVNPGMDMISCGPTIRFPHSPDEEVNIASVERFWKFLVHTLETAPKK
ncbi:MAG: aminoacyl-histidine dipeptidase [Alistipes sp.]|jgi:dipeptidase D|nr:aminoacyl-histidine dipeptidase [Alistipes sp.]